MNWRSSKHNYKTCLRRDSFSLVHHLGDVPQSLSRRRIKHFECAWTTDPLMRSPSRTSTLFLGSISCSINILGSGILQDWPQVRLSSDPYSTRRYTQDHIHHAVWIIWIFGYVFRIDKRSSPLHILNEFNIHAQVRQVCGGLHWRHSDLFQKWRGACKALVDRANAFKETSAVCQIQQMRVLVGGNPVSWTCIVCKRDYGRSEQSQGYSRMETANYSTSSSKLPWTSWILPQVHSGFLQDC